MKMRNLDSRHEVFKCQKSLLFLLIQYIEKDHSKIELIFLKWEYIENK
jgi:hypothetical protein